MQALIGAPAAPAVLAKRPAPVSRVCVFRTAAAPSSVQRAAGLLSGSHERASRVILFAKGGKKGGGSSDDDSGKKGGKGGKDKGAASGGDANYPEFEKAVKADTEDRMKKTMTVLQDNFNTIRTGRANPAILDRVMVDQYGTPTPLKSVAAVSVPEATTLLISPFDKASLKAVEKALNESDLGLNPSNDGEKIRLSLPPLTQDRRKELVKQVAKFGEDTKVAVRNVRKDVLKKNEKVELSKDNKKALEDAIQKVTDAYCTKVDQMVKTKSDELMKI